MADVNLAQVKQNVATMVSKGAPESDIDSYIQAEGTTISAIKAFQLTSTATQTPISNGIGSIADHPFKAALNLATQPLAKTLTGQSFQDMAQNNQSLNVPPATQRPFDSNVQQARSVLPLQIANQAGAGMLGSAADIATTTASYIPIPGAGLLGKIPIGSTTLGRIASNVAVDGSFGQGVQELQRMESALQKSGQLNSPGIKVGTQYDPSVDQKIVQAHSAIMNPVSSMFKGAPGKIDTWKQKVADGYKTVNDFLGNNPKPSNPQQALDSTTHTLQDLYHTYTSQAQDASARGATVDLGSIAKNVLDPLLNNKQIARHQSSLLPYIQQLSDSYKVDGKVPIDEAQTELESLNKGVGQYMKSSLADDHNKGAVQLALSQAIRQQADSGIMDAMQAGGYQDLRHQYGAVRTVQDGLTKAVATQMKAKNGLQHPLLDVMSGVNLGDALLHAATGNLPGALASGGRGLVEQGVKYASDFLRSPDRRIQSIFSNIDKAKQVPGNNPISNQVMQGQSGSLLPSLPQSYGGMRDAELMGRNIPQPPTGIPNLQGRLPDLSPTPQPPQPFVNDPNRGLTFQRGFSSSGPVINQGGYVPPGLPSPPMSPEIAPTRAISIDMSKIPIAMRGTVQRAVLRLPNQNISGDGFNMTDSSTNVGNMIRQSASKNPKLRKKK